VKREIGDVEKDRVGLMKRRDAMEGLNCGFSFILVFGIGGAQRDFIMTCRDGGTGLCKMNNSEKTLVLKR
jgi:hypothetical protein